MSVLGKALLGFVGFVALGAVVGRSLPAKPTVDIAADIKTRDFTWRKGGFDNVMIVESVTLANSGHVSVKDLHLGCTLTGPSGTVLSSVATVLYEHLPAGKARTFRNVRVGWIHPQATRAACSVTYADTDS